MAHRNLYAPPASGYDLWLSKDGAQSRVLGELGGEGARVRSNCVLTASQCEPAKETRSHPNKIASANYPGLPTEADLRKKLMKSMKLMKSVSKPFPNPFAVGAVILTCLILLAGCSEDGGSGGRIETVCEDYCVRLHVDCGIPEGKGLCVGDCQQDLEEAEELDGTLCSDAELIALTCMTDEVGDNPTPDDCDDIFAFFNLLERQLPFPVCTVQIDDAVDLCPQSIDLAQ
jgi:hypothetical protein